MDHPIVEEAWIFFCLEIAPFLDGSILNLRLKLDFLAVLVYPILGLIIEPLNFSPHLGMELLNFLYSLLGLPTKLGWSREGCKVNRSTRVEPIHNLEWRETRGFAWRSILGKLGVAKQLIPTFCALLG